MVSLRYDSFMTGIADEKEGAEVNLEDLGGD